MQIYSFWYGYGTVAPKGSAKSRDTLFVFIEKIALAWSIFFIVYYRTTMGLMPIKTILLIITC